MSESWAETCRRVVTRAGSRCEYCRMSQSLQGATFHVEHVTPRSLGGSDSPDNLALACPACNLAKSNRTTAPDPECGFPALLFHPRQHIWAEHFA